MLRISFDFCPVEFEKSQRLQQKLRVLQREIRKTCKVCEELAEAKRQRKMARGLPFDGFFPEFDPDLGIQQVRQSLKDVAKKSYIRQEASIVMPTGPPEQDSELVGEGMSKEK